MVLCFQNCYDFLEKNILVTNTGAMGASEINSPRTSVSNSEMSEYFLKQFK